MSEPKPWSLLEAAPDAIVIVNRDGRILLVNAQTEALFGYNRLELLGKPVEILIPERFRTGHLMHRGGYHDNPRTRPMGASLELFGARKDGTEFPVEISLSPIETSEGVLVTAIIRDVTERRVSEAKLRESESRFRGLLEAAPDAIVIVDRSGRIVLVNSQTEAIFGHKRDDLLSKPIETLIPERFRGGHFSFREGYFSQPRTRPMGANLELFGLRSDGSEFPVEISLSPMVEGDQVLVTAIIRDVSERKQAEQLRLEALRQADKVKEEFLSILSHELRTPINAITGFGSILMDGVVGEVPSEQRYYLERMLDAADALAYLVDDLLDMTRIQAGRFSIRPEATNFPEIVESAVGRFARQAAEKKLLLINEVETTLPPIYADRERITQVVSNLLGNAIKFTPEGGRIQVRARRADGVLRCEVEDSGPGIEEEARQKVFQRFGQLDTSSTRRQGGLGLGLSISKAIVEGHGGKIGVESTPGEGCTFWFELPLAPIAVC